MASWDVCDPPGEEHYRRDFVLKQPSTVGPWVALGLGVTLVAFLGYLIYVNMLLPPPVVVFSERLGHFETAATSARMSSQRQGQRRRAAVTVMSQGRAPHALLGGQGPALLPEQSVTPVLPASPAPRSGTP